jgi:membrane-associated protease RseP (regulator of RpoE activity)
VYRPETWARPGASDASGRPSLRHTEANVFSYEASFKRQTDLVSRLRQQVEGLFSISDVRTIDQGDGVIFIGQLLQSAESAYSTLRERFNGLGYTPVLRREGNQDIVMAHRGVFAAVRFNPLINLVLLLATLFTTLLAGASFAGVDGYGVLIRAWSSGQWAAVIPALYAGLPFAGTLLFILGVHEMGHYVAARLHGVNVTLPYFIPVPFLGLGTFGAFIQMKSPVENRKALFDVGVAGPLAGFVVALPLMIIGLLQSQVVARVGLGAFGSSLLLRGLAAVFLPHAANAAIRLSPMAIAAWFGLLVTAINLLPMGQLDGGHVTYAVLGRWSRPIALASFGLLVVLGLTVWNGWLIWALFALITGLQHPQPLNDITPLDWGRRLVGLFTLVLFFLLITPRPF